MYNVPSTIQVITKMRYLSLKNLQSLRDAQSCTVSTEVRQVTQCPDTPFCIFAACAISRILFGSLSSLLQEKLSIALIYHLYGAAITEGER